MEAGTTSVQTQRGSPIFHKDMDTIFEKFSPSEILLKLPCFMMDPSFTENADFFGRENILEMIDKRLLPDPRAVAASIDPTRLSIAVIWGMAGLGKTEIALAFALTRRANFDAVFWICAENEAELEREFCRIAIELGLQDQNEQSNPTVTKNKVKAWLSNPRKIVNGSDDKNGLDEANWLIIFDNADTPSILQDYLQIYGRGSILITSRDPSAQDCHPDILPIALEPFKEDEASTFLNSLTRKSSEEDEDYRIVRHLAGLPLAIAQMAGVIRNQFLTYADLLESLENPEERSELYSTEEGGVNKTARGDLSSIWMLNRLTAEARALLEIISLLSPDQIGDDLLLQREQGKLIVPMTRVAFNKARAMLLHWSLIRHNDGKGEIWMHRVPRQVVRASLGGQAKHSTFLCALKLIQNAWPHVDFEKRHNRTTFAMRDKLIPHVMSLQQFYETEWDIDDPEIDFIISSLLQETAW